jgi:hypothetical protein
MAVEIVKTTGTGGTKVDGESIDGRGPRTSFAEAAASGSAGAFATGVEGCAVGASARAQAAMAIAGISGNQLVRERFIVAPQPSSAGP